MSGLIDAIVDSMIAKPPRFVIVCIGMYVRLRAKISLRGSFDRLNIILFLARV